MLRALGGPQLLSLLAGGVLGREDGDPVCRGLAAAAVEEALLALQALDALPGQEVRGGAAVAPSPRSHTLLTVVVCLLVNLTLITFYNLVRKWLAPLLNVIATQLKPLHRARCGQMRATPGRRASWPASTPSSQKQRCRPPPSAPADSGARRCCGRRCGRSPRCSGCCRCLCGRAPGLQWLEPSGSQGAAVGHDSFS